jgi:hypothetical protein
MEAATALVVPRKKLILDFDEDVFCTVEDTLDREITALIQQRNELTSIFRPVAAAYRHSRRELTALKLKLGEKLHAMKHELATKGRGGKWADYLRKWNNFPRTSADRYIANYQSHTSLAELMKRPTGAFSAEPSAVQPSDSRAAEETTRKIASETLKEVSLRMNEKDHSTFMSAIEQLSKKFETKGATRTVFAAVMHCLRAVQQ